MNVSITIFTVLLFVALTPGVLFYFPKKGSKMTVALFHGIIFALVYQLTYKTILRFTGYYSIEPFYKGTDNSSRPGDLGYKGGKAKPPTAQENAQFEARGKVLDTAMRLGVINVYMNGAETDAAINKSLMPGGAMYKEKHKNDQPGQGGWGGGGGVPRRQ
jgi:hypothetical protein